MKRDDVFPSKYYRGGDFEQPKVLVIESIRLESLKQPNGETTTKPVAYFKGAKKSLVLNRTNWDVIADIVGRDDTDTWPGTRIELYSVTQEVRGEMRACARIRLPETELPLANRRPAAKAKPPKPRVADDLDDEIPFTK